MLGHRDPFEIPDDELEVFECIAALPIGARSVRPEPSETEPQSRTSRASSPPPKLAESAAGVAGLRSSQGDGASGANTSQTIPTRARGRPSSAGYPPSGRPARPMSAGAGPPQTRSLGHSASAAQLRAQLRPRPSSAGASSPPRRPAADQATAADHLQSTPHRLQTTVASRCRRQQLNRRPRSAGAQLQSRRAASAYLLQDAPRNPPPSAHRGSRPRLRPQSAQHSRPANPNPNPNPDPNPNPNPNPNPDPSRNRNPNPNQAGAGRAEQAQLRTAPSGHSSKPSSKPSSRQLRVPSSAELRGLSPLRQRPS